MCSEQVFLNKIQEAFLKLSLCAREEGSVCVFRGYVHVGNQPRARLLGNAAEFLRCILNFLTAFIFWA